MQPMVLVTGGNGFLALHLIQQLLTAGYPVRATLRSLDKVPTVRQALTAHMTPNMTQLSFITADLTQDTGWVAAMTGVTTVMSVAAPVFVNGETVAHEVEQAAADGTLRILKAANQAGVKRVVMTGNLGAVGFSRLDHQGPVTEADWTNPAQPGLSLYERSKLIAEQRAWAYVRQPQVAVQLTVINAGAMLGPALGTHVSGSFGLVSRLLAGQVTPNYQVNVVDVRDVARLHVLAMQVPVAANQRFLAVADDALTAKQVIILIQQQRPALASQLTKRLLPTWLVRGLAPFSQPVKEVWLMMRLNHQVSNQHAREVLGWQPMSDRNQAVLAAVDSLS